MQRMVTKEDLISNPDLHKKGVSVNQYYDFSATSITPTTVVYSSQHYDITENTSVGYGAAGPIQKKEVPENIPKKKGAKKKPIG